VWNVEGFGQGVVSEDGTAPIHFGDTKHATEEPAVEPESPVKPTLKTTPRKPALRRAAAKKLAKKGRR
jgi:hypothetical protein